MCSAAVGGVGRNLGSLLFSVADENGVDDAFSPRDALTSAPAHAVAVAILAAAVAVAHARGTDHGTHSTLRAAACANVSAAVLAATVGVAIALVAETRAAAAPLRAAAHRLGRRTRRPLQDVTGSRNQITTVEAAGGCRCAPRLAVGVGGARRANQAIA